MAVSARVAYTKVERQFKLRGIPYVHVTPLLQSPTLPDLGYINSSLAIAMPGLCVQAADILSGAPAAEAAMPNIRVIAVNWWSQKKPQVRYPLDCSLSCPSNNPSVGRDMRQVEIRTATNW